MKKDKLYFIGENRLSGEAIQKILVEKGYDAFFGNVQSSFKNSRVLEVKPDIIIWDESLIETREATLFDLWSH